MDKLLITGATGYIGGKLAEFYLKSALELRLLVRNPQQLSDELKKRCDVFQGDITQPESLPPSLQGVTAVIHAAGLLGHWGTPYRQLWDVNVKGTENLIRAAIAAQVKCFLHLSAGGVTGPLKPRVVDEDYHPQPFTEYERTKWEGEQLALQIAKQENFDLLVLRPTFTYGPGDPHKLALFRSLKQHRFAFIGDGFSTLHPVYIDDLIIGIDLALRSTLRGMSLILGGDRAVTKQELVFAMSDALGARRPTLYFPVWLGKSLAYGCELAATLLGFQPSLTRSRVLMLSGNWGYSIERARTLLGYQPQISLSEGLRRTVAWYRERQWL